MISEGVYANPKGEGCASFEIIQVRYIYELCSFRVYANPGGAGIYLRALLVSRLRESRRGRDDFKERKYKKFRYFLFFSRIFFEIIQDIFTSFARFAFTRTPKGGLVAYSHFVYPLKQHLV